MSLAHAISRTPVPHDSDRADDVLARCPWASAEMKSLLAGAAGCSPYLAGLISAQAGWLEGAIEDDPGHAVAAELAALAPGGAGEVAVALRRAKARVALLTALADLGGVWDLDTVTATLTRLADTALDVALKTALAPVLQKGSLPGQGPEALEGAAGLVALAMGKMGAFELNFSSDIDLIVLFDDARYEARDLPEVRATLVKVVRRAMALLSDQTGEGYVFRTDLRLRPDPSVTPVALSVSAAERYYEAMGRAWERAAFVKARPAAGHIATGTAFLETIRPFVWRRHLDFATVEDTHSIRRKIREHKATGRETTLDRRNVKLGPGGIREIEFFVQTRQLIAGGRDPTLRERGTRAALARLTERGWVPEADATQLDADYVRLREIEHRLQMVRDAQTHDLPSAPDDWLRLARFTGSERVDGLRDELEALMRRVHEVTEDFFAPHRPETRPPDMTPTAQRLVGRWRNYPALRSSRAREIFDRLLPRLLEGFQRAARPDEAIVQFDGFLAGLPSGVQVFSLFEANPQLIDLMVDISSTAPALARYLADHPGVLDSVLAGRFFSQWPGRDSLAGDLTEHLERAGTDFEHRLDAARRWKKDWHFRTGVHHLRALIGPQEAAREYADLAEAALAGIWEATCAEFARRHGPLPGRGAVVMGMGSLGARRLTAASDLDLIVVYDAPGSESSDGPKPLAVPRYYARLTKALVTALSAHTAAGALYDVDMRLRPSGRQGPVAASWSSYQTYHKEEAWTWEHLALTRARVLTGEPALAADLEAFRRAVLAQPRDRAAVAGDLAAMRARIFAARPRQTVWQVSDGPGGLQDIELFAQAAALLSGAPETTVEEQLGCTAGLANAQVLARLDETQRLQFRVKAVGRLLTDRALDPDALGHGGQEMLLRDTACSDFAALARRLEEASAAAATEIDTALGSAGARGPSGD